jgi:CHAT domain/Kelch motif
VVVKPLRYDDFDVLIERSDGTFRARVVSSPGGETDAQPFVLPVTPEKLELMVLRMRTAHGVRGLATDTTSDTRQFGSELFDALFHDDLLDRLRNSLTWTDAHGHGLRIRLRFSHAHELWNIPWELLYDHERHRFLCQFDTTPVVRYVDMAQPVQPLVVHGPIRMLAMISSPSDYPPLDVDKEWQQLSDSLTPLVATGSLTVEKLPAASLEELRHTMMFGDFHVFHYIGHGGIDKQTGDGLLVLTGSDGRSQLATGPELFVMLANSPIRLAVLNSCQGAQISTIDPYAGTAASLVHQGIPAVIAMQFEISDQAAIAFSRTLYEAIAYGWPVDVAVGEARRAILAASKSEWATPVLYLRAPDGHLVDITKPDRTPAPAQPTGLAGSVADQLVDLHWATVPAGLTPVTRWEVRRDGVRVCDVTQPRASDQPSGPGSYRYSVVAVSEDGQRSTESATWIAVVPDVISTPIMRPQPAAPTGLSGSVTAGRVDLRWDAVEPGSVARWEVLRDGALVTQPASPGANDNPPGPGSYEYTVVAVGEDGQRSALSGPWTAEVLPDGRPWWIIAALALLAVAVATTVLLVWAPWEPDDTGPSGTPASAPVPPAGLEGDPVSGTKIDLQWDSPPAGSAPVAHWKVLRDGEVVIKESPEPRATVANEGFYTYTVIAVGEDGQESAESDGWNSLPAWQKLEDTGFQEIFSAAGVAEHNGELWVVGGQYADRKRDDVRVLDTQTGEWRDGPKLPIGVSHAPLVSTGEKLYLLGGLTVAGTDEGVPLRTVYSLDPEDPDGTWTEDVPLPAPRYAGAAAWDGQRLVFGGGAELFEPNTPRPAAANIWELQSGGWEPVGKLTQAREHLAAVTDKKGAIWFAGGVDVSSKSVFENVDLLSGDTVSSSTPISTAVQGAAAIWTSATGVCVFGGSTVRPNVPSEPVAEVECVGGTGQDPRWPDLLHRLASTGAALVGNTVYVVGGNSDRSLEAADMVLELRFG